ncbi:MAG: glucosaminidase domain-containing protein [Alphaproteobacteria bacterium]
MKKTSTTRHDTQAAGASTFQRLSLAGLGLAFGGLTALGIADLARASAGGQPPAAHGAATEVRQSASASLGARLAKPLKVHTVSSTGKLSDLFRRVGYELDGVHKIGPVPRVLLASLPKDLANLSRAAQRKIVFIQCILPLVLQANEHVTRERLRILDLQDRVLGGKKLTGAEKAWLAEVADRYGLERVDFASLLERVDIVPPSLAIAQAAEESGWGTSRFAREGNALFGQRIYKDNRPGIVPTERGEGESYKVRAFDHLLQGVAAYVHNLNSHFAYDGFREARAGMRGERGVIEGYRLVETLERYSERGETYLETIKLIMRVNKLQLLDRAWLRDLSDEFAVPPDA